MHGVDGGFLQRFAGQVDFKEGESSNMRDQRDEIGDRVREAAEKEGRVWAIMCVGLLCLRGVMLIYVLQV